MHVYVYAYMCAYVHVHGYVYVYAYVYAGDVEDFMADNRLSVALDFHKFDDVKSLVEKLGDSVSFYKVGMELFYSEGAQTVAYLK